MSPIFLVVFCLQVGGISGFYTNFFHAKRLNRHCHGPHGADAKNLAMEEFGESKLNLIFFLISGLIFLLIFLGLIKGLIGLCCWKKVGEYGINLLIDLPRHLPSYQEKSIRSRPVVYDVGGWPVHPDTLQPTVRVLPKRTEFCLNLVFFLACPLAALVYLCSLLCCIRNYKSRDDECFKHVDVVKLTSVPTKKGRKKGDNVDMYKEDSKEEQDTRYVLDAMERSLVSIDEIRLCTHDK